MRAYTFDAAAGEDAAYDHAHEVLRRYKPAA